MTTDDRDTLARLAKAAFRALFVTHNISFRPDWKNFSLKDAVGDYERNLIKMALVEMNGSVTKTAALLGFPHHQNLISIINTRHKDLLTSRAPIRKRRKHIIKHAKRKSK